MDVKQSSIEKAGNGAFLTYLGARVLEAGAASRSARLLKEHVVDIASPERHDFGTQDSLVAEFLPASHII